MDLIRALNPLPDANLVQTIISTFQTVPTKASSQQHGQPAHNDSRHSPAATITSPAARNQPAPPRPHPAPVDFFQHSPRNPDQQEHARQQQKLRNLRHSAKPAANLGAPGSGTSPKQAEAPLLRINTDAQGLLHPANPSIPGVYILDPLHPLTVERDTDAAAQAKAGLFGPLLGAGLSDTENPLVRHLSGLPQRDALNPRVATTDDGRPVLLHLVPRIDHPRYDGVANSPHHRAAEANLRSDIEQGTQFAPSQEGMKSWRSWATLGLAPVAEHCGRSFGLAEGYAANNSTQAYGYGQADEQALRAAAGDAARFAGRRTVSAFRGLEHVRTEMYRIDQREAGIITSQSYVSPPRGHVSRVSATRGLTQQGRIAMPGRVDAPRGANLMYVIDENGQIVLGRRLKPAYKGQKVPRLPHPTLVGGRDPRVRAAGVVEFDGAGRIMRINNASGHFRPDAKTLARARDAFGQLPTSAFSPRFEGYVDHTGRVTIEP